VAGHPLPVPVSIVLGLTVITLVGLLDDVAGDQPAGEGGRAADRQRRRWRSNDVGVKAGCGAW
jgi:hypothetical protein